MQFTLIMSCVALIYPILCSPISILDFVLILSFVPPFAISILGFCTMCIADIVKHVFIAVYAL